MNAAVSKSRLSRLMLPFSRANVIPYLTRSAKCRSKHSESKVDPEEVQPIQYSKSEAAKWQAKYTHRGERYYKAPRAESISAVVSVCVFMIYFCILREENDLDEWLDSIYKSTPMTIEEAILRSQIADDSSKGKDVTAKRLLLASMVEKRTNGALHM